MCLIVTSSSGFKELPRHFWRAACATFTDGLGVMFHDGETLVIRKFEEYGIAQVIHALSDVPSGVQVAVHFREATYGARCPRNMHPQVLRFTVPEYFALAVMHNGSIPSLQADPLNGPSDTSLLVHSWLRDQLEADPKTWSRPEFLTKLLAFVGPGNRLVLLDMKGTLRVLGSDIGFTLGETWLSNRKVQPWI